MSRSDAVELDAGAVLLGQVHGDVGLPQQRLDVGPVIGEHRDADADVDVEQRVVDDERLGDRHAHATGHLDGREVVVQTREHHGELVAAETGHRVAGPHGAADAAGRDGEQLVARGVAQGVVDLLEAVEVEQQDADPGVVAPRASRWRRRAAP